MTAAALVLRIDAPTKAMLNKKPRCNHPGGGGVYGDAIEKSRQTQKKNLTARQ
jgi:hypothetical protein